MTIVFQVLVFPLHMASNISHGAFPWFSAEELRGVCAQHTRGRAMRGGDLPCPGSRTPPRPATRLLSLRYNILGGLNGLTRVHISVA